MLYGETPANQQIVQASWTSGDVGPFGTCLDLSLPFCPAAWRIYGQRSFVRHLKVENDILCALLKCTGPIVHRSRRECLVRAQHKRPPPGAARECVWFLLEPDPSFAKRSFAKAGTAVATRLYYRLLLVPCHPHAATSEWFLWKQPWWFCLIKWSTPVWHLSTDTPTRVRPSRGNLGVYKLLNF